MATDTPVMPTAAVTYPTSDGQPMADSSKLWNGGGNEESLE
ncbi:MAG: hypothetical protein ACLFVO_29790 [Chloroflexaceae bacterium]